MSTSIRISEETTTRIAIIVGGTRPNRNARDVADWVLEYAPQGGDAQFELVDIADHNLPLLDEPLPPAMGEYENKHTKKWAETIASYDGFVSYGSAGGTRSVEAWLLIAAERQMADVRAQVFLHFGTDFAAMSTFEPTETFKDVFTQVTVWANVLKPLRG